jgi:hypothetical protein
MISSSSGAVSGSLRMPRAVDDGQGDGRREVDHSLCECHRVWLGEIIEQSVDFAVDHAIALLDKRLVRWLAPSDFSHCRAAIEARHLRVGR